jgi:hypothetical protein
MGGGVEIQSFKSTRRLTFLFYREQYRFTR